MIGIKYQSSVIIMKDSFSLIKTNTVVLLISNIFIIPFGDWEKNPRLQAKTLVCLRYGALPQIQSYSVWCQISYLMDHEIPQACPEWADRWSGPRVGPGNLQVQGSGNLQVQGCWDHPRSCFCWWWQALVGFSLFSKLPPSGGSSSLCRKASHICFFVAGVT